MIVDGPEVGTALVMEAGRWTALLRTLTDEDLDQSTRCEGWSVRDVIAHVVGRFGDIAEGRFDGLGDADTVDAHRRELAHLAPAALLDRWVAASGVSTLAMSFSAADLVAPAPGDFNGSLGQAIEFLAQELWVHGDDIDHALGRPPRPGPGAVATVSRFVRLSTEVRRPPALFLMDERYLVSIGDPRGLEAIPCSLVHLALVGTGRGDRSALGLDERYDLYYPEER